MITKKQSELCRWGAYCAFVSGICYVLIVGCAMLSPASIASYVASPTYFNDFKSYQSIFIFLKAIMMLANASFVGVILAFHSLVRSDNYGKMTVISVIAIIGLGVGIFQSVIDMTMVPYLADQYYNGNDLVKHMIIVLGVANPSIYIVSLGFPGMWFMVVSWMAVTNPHIPRPLVMLGFIWGLGNIATVIAHVFVMIWLIQLVAFGALIAAPIWSIWEGFFLLNMAKKNTQRLPTR
jgi:hypothetical protein